MLDRVVKVLPLCCPDHLCMLGSQVVAMEGMELKVGFSFVEGWEQKY